MSNDATQFSMRPGLDFTRSGKLGFAKTIQLLLSMEGNSLNTELLRFFQYDSESPSASAFVQSRSKLHPNTLPSLFRAFVRRQGKSPDFSGYRLFAVDGSSLNIPSNPLDADSRVVSKENQRPYNLLHLHALYDLCSKTYADAIVEGVQVFNEQRALIRMMKAAQCPKAILLADRGYESYNVLAHIQQKGWKFLIRLRNNRGIVGGLILPSDPEFDVSLDLKLSHKTTKAAKALYSDKNHFKPTIFTRI